MKIIHLHPENFKTTAWSGGTTTELYLYPENGSYAARDFQLRISSATVDLAESDFTPLPGVERFITPLTGSFVLTHPGKPPVELPPLSRPYRFSGDIPTHCVGKATDFNLMLKGCGGQMDIFQGNAPVRRGFNGFYPTSPCRLTLDGQTYPLEKGDLLVVFSRSDASAALDGGPVLTCWAEIE